MAVTVISVSTQTSQDDNTDDQLTINFGTHVSGDMLVALINTSNGGPNTTPAPTIAAKTGWTVILETSTAAATANGLYLAYHLATSTDEILTTDFVSSIATGYVGTGVVIRGADLSNPIDVSAAGTAQGNAASNTTADVTTTVDDVLVVRCVSKDDDADTFVTPSPGGYVLRVRISDALPGNGTTSAWYDMIEATAGATGTEVISWTGDSEENVSGVFGVRPIQGESFNQQSFRGRNDDGSETTATWIAAANTNWIQDADANFRVRFLVQGLTDVEDLGVEYQLQYNKNAAGWNDVNGASLNVRSFASPNVVDGLDTTQQLGSGTFIATNGGFDEVDGLTGTVDWTTTVNQETEAEYCIQIRDVDTVPGDTIQLRLVKEADIEFNVYQNTPTVTVTPPAYTQESFRGRNDDGSETAATWIATVNTNWSQATDANFRLRFLVQETADIADTDVTFQLQYNHNLAGWNNVDATSLVARSFASTNFVDGADTTQQLGVGTFVTPNAGLDEVDGIAGGTALDFTTTVNQEVELEFCIQLRSVDVAANDTVQLRLITANSAGSVTVYSNTPMITVFFPPHWEMNLSANFVDGDPTTAQLTAGTFSVGEIKELNPSPTAETDLPALNVTEHEFCIQAISAAVTLGQYEFRLVDLTHSGEKYKVYVVIPKITLA